MEDNKVYLNVDNDIKGEYKKTNLVVAKKYFDIYNYLKERDDIKNSDDPVEYFRELNKSYYMVNGRYLTDEEIIAYEISNIKSYLISNQYDKSEYKDDINRLYNNLVKLKVSFKREKIEDYHTYINIIFCLLDKLPPFLDEIYEKCENIENRRRVIFK